MVEKVHERNTVVLERKTVVEKLSLDGVQGFHERLKGPKACIKGCSPLFKPSHVNGGEQPREPRHAGGRRIGHRQFNATGAPHHRASQQMAVLWGEKRCPSAEQASEPPLRLFERPCLFFRTSLRKGRFSPGQNTKPAGDGSWATEHVELP